MNCWQRISFPMKKAPSQPFWDLIFQAPVPSCIWILYSPRLIMTSLPSILEESLGIDHVELIKCGGEDMIAAEREQWNDGSNTLCIAPGSIITYERNTRTNKLLKDKGLHVIEIPSAELSRGRGGPRCMSMPLERESVNI